MLTLTVFNNNQCQDLECTKFNRNEMSMYIFCEDKQPRHSCFCQTAVYSSDNFEYYNPKKYKPHPTFVDVVCTILVSNYCTFIG